MKHQPPSGPDSCELDRVEGREVFDFWARRWLHHLQTGCRCCWASLSDPSKPPARLDEVEIARLLQKAQAEAPHLFAEAVEDRPAANRFVDRLERLSPEHQRLVIANSKWACSAAVCKVLIEKSKRTRYIEPLASLRFAELSARAGRRLASRSGLVLMARALDEVSAARTATSDFVGAARALDEAEKLLQDSGTQAIVLANVWSSRAVLSTHLGRFQIARQLLKQASHLYSQCGSVRADVCTKLRLGNLYRECGKPSRALPIEAEALQASKKLDDQELRLSAFQNLIVSSVEAGDLQTATQWFEDARPIFRTAAASTFRLRFDWVDARYTCARGNIRVGVSRLQAVRDQFRAVGHLAELKTISLELARNYLRLGLRSEARPILSEVVDISTSLGVQHERRQALALLRS